jgi:hypothetical protein
MPPRRTRLISGSITALITPFFVPGVHAQDPPPLPPPVIAPEAPRPAITAQDGSKWKLVRSLKDGLDQMAWNGETRGPLLALRPEGVMQKMPERDPDDWYTPYKPPQPLGAPANSRGYRVEELGAYFGRRVIRCGSLSVLAPDEMVVLNVPTTPANPFADLRREEKMALLQATLTPEQWRMFASPNGIGLGDLKQEQKQLFLSILPNPMRVMKMTPSPDGYGNRIESVPGQDPRTTLSEAQRQATRLRLNRTVNMMIPAAGQGENNYGTSVWNRPQGNRTFYNLAAPGEWQKKTLFGQQIRQKIPTKLKQGHIDFDAQSLNVRVSLTDAKTVADLLKRVSEATRYEIFADTRVGNMSVWVSEGENSVRAGDLLRALAWAVTGTYRKVGPTYQLTHDVMGIGQMKGRIAEWSMAAEAALQKTQREARINIQKAGPLQYMTFAADDPLTLSPEMMQRVEASWKKPAQGFRGELFRMNELPPAFQTLAKETIERYNQNQSREAAVRPLITDRVNVNISSKLTLIIPGLGEVEGADFGNAGMGSLIPPTMPGAEGSEVMRTDAVKLPDAMTAGGTLCIAPTTPEEAKRAVALASERKLRQVWVMLPVEPGDGKEMLEAAVKAGQAAKIPVCAVVRVMLANPKADGPPPGSPESDRDINIFGETGAVYGARRRASGVVSMNFNPFGSTVPMGDWLRPDAVTAQALVQRRMKEIAKTPGLAGIVLVDAAAPGYNAKTGGMLFGIEPGAEFGFSIDRRIAAVRGAGLDPIDIGGQSFGGRGVQMDLPFFPDINMMPGMVMTTAAGAMETTPDPRASAAAKFGQSRFDLTGPFLASVHKAIRAEQPNLPIYLRELTGGIWFGPWEKPDKLPILGNQGFGSPEDFERAARETAKTLLFAMKATPNLAESLGMIGAENGMLTLPQAYARFTRMVAFPQAQGGIPFKVDGLVFDVTELSFEQGMKLIRDAVAEQSVATPPPASSPANKSGEGR